MNPRTIDIIKSAELIVHKLLAVKPGENVMIICDPGSEMSMAYTLAGVVESVKAEYTIAIMPTREHSRANDLTPMIEKGLEAADCLIGLTRFSGAPTYSKAVKKLYNEKKLRTISMVMRDLENFTRGGALADYEQLFAEGKHLATIWDNAKRIRVTTLLGTDMTATIGNAASIIECGFATEPGQEAAFSDGEVSQGPNEGTSEGVIVVDGPICYLGTPDQPVKVHVSNGRVSKIDKSGRTAQELNKIIESIPNADNIAEIGIGLNGWSLRNGDFEEEKKGRGNVHIAIGDNIFYGGQTQSSIHMDMVLYQPTVYLDDLVVVDNGKVVLPEKTR